MRPRPDCRANGTIYCICVMLGYGIMYFGMYYRRISDAMGSGRKHEHLSSNRFIITVS